MEIKRRESETQLDYVKRIVEGKLVNKSIKVNWEDLSEHLFGEGNCYNESEVRKRCYGMKHLLEIMDKENNENENNVSKNTRILSISDSHVPFNLPVCTFEKYANKVDVLVFNGDILDMQSISKFPKLYRISPIQEMVLARQYIIDVINLIKPKKVLVNYGNHEIRFIRYLTKQLDNELVNLMPDTALEAIIVDGFYDKDRRTGEKTWYPPLYNMFDDIEIEYSNRWYCKYGKAIFCHPSAYSSGILKTVDKSLRYFVTQDTDFDTIVMAHTHMLGSFIRGNVYLFEQGTTSDTKQMNYSDGLLHNPQQQGYIYLEQDEEGKLVYENSKLIKI
jgi:predicted phosphodiesterase